MCLSMFLYLVFLFLMVLAVVSFFLVLLYLSSLYLLALSLFSLSLLAFLLCFPVLPVQNSKRHILWVIFLGVPFGLALKGKGTYLVLGFLAGLVGGIFLQLTLGGGFFPLGVSGLVEGFRGFFFPFTLLLPFISFFCIFLFFLLTRV